ncbi:MAG: hypothetical protein JOZ43_00655 [Acidobacteriales bacterium]|nr:hypothetical protein [Terriglobales bacterium]
MNLHSTLRVASVCALLSGAFSAAFGTCTATVNQTVKICTPANGASVGSPVAFSAGALDTTHPITGMILYVDNVNKAKSSNNQLSASVALVAGKHSIIVRAWNSTGAYFSSSESITVTSGPTVTINASPTIINAGQSSTLTVTAQNASSVVVTDNIDTNQYPLSPTGGTVTVTPAKTAVYTATATSSSGSQSTATATVNVNTGGGGNISVVNHVLFLMQENRSFDHYFGMLNPYRQAHGYSVGDDGVTYSVDGIDDKLGSISNVNDEGQAFSLFHTTSSCLDDMTAGWLESYGDVSRWDFTPNRPIVMDGYVHNAEGFAKSGAGSGAFTDTIGRRAMAYYKEVSTTGAPELNYYYYMASQFALSDRWFSPVSAKSIPNRLASMSGGTTQGYVYDPGNDDHAMQLTAQTIFQLLDANGISWKIYYGHTNTDGTPSTTFSYFSYSNKYIYRNSQGQLVIDSTHIAPMSQYYQDVANGALPAFSYIEPNSGVNDEHPGSGQSILTGQQNSANILNAFMYSSSWQDSVFFFAFDEAGGLYDHVPPVPGYTNKFTDSGMKSIEGDVSPISVNPDSYLPCPPATPGVYTNHCDVRPGAPGAKTTDAAHIYGFAAQIGFRVPNMIISPFARRHYVGHRSMDHTAVLRFLEERYNLPALTKRDAAQPDLLDFFDFNAKPWLTPPAQTGLPVPPPVGSTCHANNF